MVVAPIGPPPTKKAAAARKFKGRLGGEVPKTGGDWRGDHEGVAKKLAAGPAAEKGHPEQAAAVKGYPTRCTRKTGSGLEHCFVMNDVFWRFGELSSIQGGSGNRDLQF